MIMTLIFKENLPDNCPLPDSIEQELTDVWRFLEKVDVTEECFSSYAAQGKPVRKGVDECRWASCSLFQGDQLTASMIKTQMYKRFAARALLKIPEGSGRALKKDSGHVDFWAYSSFSFTSAIEKVEPK